MKTLKIYMTKAIDALFGGIGVIAACGVINGTDLHYECSDALLMALMISTVIATVWLKTAVCSLVMKVLIKSISDRLEKGKTE